MKSISIIVPVYYGERYIPGIIRQVEACRERLEEQDYVEIVFINDAPDTTLCSEWKSENVSIIVVNTEENVGIHGARLKGLKRCCGEYVLFLDQDDRISPEYLCSQLCAVGDNDAVVCRAIHDQKLYYSECPVFENILSKELMLKEWNPIISPGQVLLRRISIPVIWIDNVLRYNGADDWFLWLCMLSENRSFTLNQEVLYEHVLSGENTSDNVLSMLQSEQEVMGLVQEKKLFSDSDFKLLLDSFFFKNLNRVQGLNFFKMKWDTWEKWIRLKENKVRFSEHLIQLGLRTIAIYGCGTLGEYLYTELKEDVDVKYFIDRNAEQFHKKIPVYSLQEGLPKVDGVVVTLIGETDNVEKELRRMLYNKVLILKDWIKDTKLL